MINVLFLFLLIVTIPRYSGTFADIDTWEVFGVSVTAIGIAVVAGIGEYYLTKTRNRCRREKARYETEWKILDEANKSAGKKTRKADHIPELQNSEIVLFGFLFALEAIGLGTQVVHFVSVIRGQAITVTLPGPSLWIYVGALVAQVSVLQWALATASGYEETLKLLSDQGKQQKAASEQRLGLRDLLDAAFVRAQAALLDQEAASEASSFAPEPLLENPSRFACPECSFVGKSQLALNGHMKAHSKDPVLEKGNGHR